MFSLVFAMLQCMHLVADSVPVERVWCLLCTRPWSTCDVTTMHMSQILFLSSVFCPVFVLYETMEYMQCYNDAYVLLQILFLSSMFCLVLLQILFLSSVFCLVFALYETMEYILCYNDEKRQQQEESQRAMTMTTHHRTHSTSDQSSSETARLLRADDIEQNSEWLQQSQSAFDEEEDDMFLLDGGIGAGMWQARRKGGGNGVGASAAGEAIPMSTFRAPLAQSGAQALPGSGSHQDNNPNVVETPPAKAVTKTLPVIGSGASRTVLPTAGATAIIRNVPNQPGHGASVSNITVEDRVPVEIAMETHGEGSGGALHKSSVRSSILPDMWRALTQDPESDNDSLEEELFSRGSEASVSLLHNGAVSKSYR